MCVYMYIHIYICSYTYIAGAAEASPEAPEAPETYLYELRSSKHITKTYVLLC